MNDPLLLAHGVSKTYQIGRRSLEVLKGLNFAAQAGAFVALRGSSGAGKSTLLHLLGGLDSPSAGEIWFAGKNLATFSPSQLGHFRNAKVGFVFQAYHLLPELDALENVCLPARMAREPMSDVAERARRLLARVGLGDRIEHRPFELSGGEQQRVAIARALVRNPALLLADEPTGNLDSHTGGEIIDLLCRIGEESGTTLIIATHDSKVAARAPRVVELIDGQIAQDGK
jgi:predicted ABC-type transport system involved in lysophospholipase L1 biosynthesis ATPase subunit